MGQKINPPDLPSPDGISPDWIRPARLRWSEAQQPVAEAFDDCYFSRHNGLAETEHVFIDGNGLRERWRHPPQNHFVIGETGFGSGLNFIAAWRLWQASAASGACLTFISTELYPLRKEDLQRVAQLWPELADYYAALIEQYPPLCRGFHRLSFGPVTLLLLLGDALESLRQLPDHTAVDAWFLDGFAPAKNPQLWSAELCAEIARLSTAGATAATFSAAGGVRRHLAEAGFNVHKQKGYGHKRDMTVAQRSFTQYPSTQRPARSAAIREVTVLGAGIAGACIAHVLAQQGFTVNVIEAHPQAAREASGNRQAIVYGKFSPRSDTFAEFNRSSYLYALRFYRQLSQQYPALPIHRCGILQMAWNEKEKLLQQELAPFLAHHSGIARAVSAGEASAIAGISLQHPALYFPEAGWLYPAAVCQQLLQDPRIHTRFNTTVVSLRYENEPLEKGPWQLLDAEGNVLHHCSQLVLATGHHSLQFAQTAALPLRRIRGQVSHVPPTAHSRQLKTVISGDGYMAPVQTTAEGHWQSLGASYTPKDFELLLRPEEHADNLRRLGHHAPGLQGEWRAEDIKEGRSQFRAVTPDFFPLCGPVPRQVGLWLCAALGSRGISYAPLCAQVISSDIAGTPPPLPQAVLAALDPGRFSRRREK